MYANLLGGHLIIGGCGLTAPQKKANEERNLLEDVPNAKVSDWTRYGDKYYCWINGVRHQVTREQWKRREL